MEDVSALLQLSCSRSVRRAKVTKHPSSPSFRDPLQKLLSHNSEAANWPSGDENCPSLLSFEVPTINKYVVFFFPFFPPRLLCSARRNDVIVLCCCFLPSSRIRLCSYGMIDFNITLKESTWSKIWTLNQIISQQFRYQRLQLPPALCVALFFFRHSSFHSILPFSSRVIPPIPPSSPPPHTETLSHPYRRRAARP